MKRLFEQPWIWALLGVVGLWILLCIGTGQVNLGNLTGIVASAALLCVVAIGQMLVVTTGNGAIDLSIPSVITFYGNYAGDNMNVKMAKQLAAMEGIEVKTVVANDDVASAPKSEPQKRRGVAGEVWKDRRW